MEMNIYLHVFLSLLDDDDDDDGGGLLVNAPAACMSPGPSQGPSSRSTHVSFSLDFCCTHLFVWL